MSHDTALPADETLAACPNPWCKSGHSPMPFAMRTGGFTVICGCDFHGPNRPSRAEAITAWNTRPSSSGRGEVLEEALRKLRDWIGTGSPGAVAMRKIADSALKSQPPSTGGGDIPEGMVPWYGNDSAPNDWDGAHPVKRRDGTMYIGDPNNYAWTHGGGHTDIIAYTPRATSPSAPPSTVGEDATAGERYRHKVRGTEYEMIGTAELQAAQPQHEHAELAIYRGDDGKLWARNTGEFHDGRFERIAAAPKPIGRGEAGCLCQGCGATYRVDFLVPDQLWSEITPKTGGGGLLCGSCIARRIEARGKFDAFHLVDQPIGLEEREKIVEERARSICKQLAIM